MCINQLISTIQDIYKKFDEFYEVRGVFPDISKVLDKVWYEVLLFKLNQYGVSSISLSILSDVLCNGKQRVILKGQNYSLTYVKVRVLQGPILGPILFLMYIYDFPDNLRSNLKLFAPDTFPFSVVKDN